MSYDPNAPGPAGRPPEQPAGAVAMPGGHHEQQYPTEQHYQQPQYPPQYAPQQHQHQQQHQGGGGPSLGVMAPHGRGPGMHIYPFWQRSEFWTFLLTAIAIGIACLAADTFDAQSAWRLITVLAAAYIVSRGLAKREPRSDDDDRPWEPGSGGGSGRR